MATKERRVINLEEGTLALSRVLSANLKEPAKTTALASLAKLVQAAIASIG